MKPKVLDNSTQFVPKQLIERIRLRYLRGVCEGVIFGSSNGGIEVLEHTCGLGEFRTITILPVLRFLKIVFSKDGPWFLRD